MGRDGFMHVLKLGLLAYFVVMALSTCGGEGGGADEQPEQQQQDQA